MLVLVGQPFLPKNEIPEDLERMLWRVRALLNYYAGDHLDADFMPPSDRRLYSAAVAEILVVGRLAGIDPAVIVAESAALAAQIREHHDI